MRHQKANRKLGRNSTHREAMFRNMVTSLMLHGRIQTTEAKAKEVRRLAEKIITLGKRVPPSSLEGLSGAELQKAQADRVHAIRQARKTVNDRVALEMVFNEYSELFKGRPGGYTRIYKLGFRAGDNAAMNLIELVTEPCEPKSKTAPVAEVPAAAEEPALAAEEPAVDEPAAEEAADQETADVPATEEDTGDEPTNS